MMSLSLAFHLASALGMLGLLWAVVVLKARITFLRRWVRSGPHGVLVGQPIQVLKAFSEAFDIPLLGLSAQSPALSKVSLASVARLHLNYGIEAITVLPGPPMSVSFKIHRTSATISEDQRQIEQDFGDSFRVEILCQPQ